MGSESCVGRFSRPVSVGQISPTHTINTLLISELTKSYHALSPLRGVNSSKELSPDRAQVSPYAYDDISILEPIFSSADLFYAPQDRPSCGKEATKAY
jgi:hypothetical protein